MSNNIFQNTLQKTNLILKNIEKELDWLESRADAYSLLKAVLQTLRDRLTVDVAVDFGAQLPTLLRGTFYDGWKPSKMPVKFNKSEFINEIERRFPSGPEISSEKMIMVVIKVLRNHISKEEVDKIKNMLPKEFEDLFLS